VECATRSGSICTAEQNLQNFVAYKAHRDVARFVPLSFQFKSQNAERLFSVVEGGKIGQLVCICLFLVWQNNLTSVDHKIQVATAYSMLSEIVIINFYFPLQSLCRQRTSMQRGHEVCVRGGPPQRPTLPFLSQLQARVGVRRLEVKQTDLGAKVPQLPPGHLPSKRSLHASPPMTFFNNVFSHVPSFLPSCSLASMVRWSSRSRPETALSAPVNVLLSAFDSLTKGDVDFNDAMLELKMTMQGRLHLLVVCFWRC
jgi:hypothetical protein